MIVKCDKCQGPTKEKTIKRKSDGKEFTLYECQSGCKNESGKYPYSCFPPKEEKPLTNSSPRPETILILTEISETLKRIETILANPEKLHTSKKELEPDQDIPWSEGN